MSAGVATAWRPGGQRERSFSLSPSEGWLTLVSAAVMVAVFAISLIEAAWTGNLAGSQGFLLWIGLLGFAIGTAGAKIGWGRWRTHLIGALVGGLLVPLVMGGLALGDQLGWGPSELAQRLVAALNVVTNVWDDLVVRGLSRTDEIHHYHLVFGVLVYGAGLLTGFTVFGHRRPLDAVVVVGLATLANMAITAHHQLYLLVIFSAAALFLLIRTHVFEEEAQDRRPIHRGRAARPRRHRVRRARGGGVDPAHVHGLVRPAAGPLVGPAAADAVVRGPPEEDRPAGR